MPVAIVAGGSRGIGAGLVAGYRRRYMWLPDLVRLALTAGRPDTARAAVEASDADTSEPAAGAPGPRLRQRAAAEFCRGQLPVPSNAHTRRPGARARISRRPNAVPAASWPYGSAALADVGLRTGPVCPGRSELDAFLAAAPHATAHRHDRVMGGCRGLPHRSLTVPTHRLARPPNPRAIGGMIVNIAAVGGPHVHAATALSVRSGRRTVTSRLVALVGTGGRCPQGDR